MKNIILGLMLLVIIGSAIAYIVRAQKRGVKCIGCPAAGKCAQQSLAEYCGGCGGCGGCCGGCSSAEE